MTSSFFIGMFGAAMVTNAIAVYLLHDFDADRIGNSSLAYWSLAQEFFLFGFVVAVIFFALTGIGTAVFGLRNVTQNLRLGLVLGISVILIQYPAEFTARMLTGSSSDSFLLGYMLASPICCAAVILLNSHMRRSVK